MKLTQRRGGDMDGIKTGRKKIGQMAQMWRDKKGLMWMRVREQSKIRQSRGQIYIKSKKRETL